MTEARENLSVSAGCGGALVRLTLADLLRTKRAVLGAVVLLAPVVFALYWSFAEHMTGDALYQWGIIFIRAYLNFTIPFLALLAGATLISTDRESQTLVYLLTRPVPRWKIALVKFLTAAALCIVALAASMAVAFGAVALHFHGVPIPSQPHPVLEALPYALTLGGVGAAAMIVYLALFFLAGMALKRPIVLGVIFIIFWEGLIGYMKGIIRFATVVHYLRSLAIDVTEKTVSLPSILTVQAAPAWAAATVLAVLAAASLALALAWFSRAEYPTSPDR